VGDEPPKCTAWIKAQQTAQFLDPYPSYPQVSKIIAKMFEAIAITAPSRPSRSRPLRERKAIKV